MPAYGTPQAGGVLTSLIPGDPLHYLFNAETLTAPIASIAFSRGTGTADGTPEMTFQISFVSAPTAVVVIQGSNQDIDALYATLWTSTNTQDDNYTDTARWAFYRARLVSQSGGGALTVTVKR